MTDSLGFLLIIKKRIIYGPLSDETENKEK